MCYVEQNQQKHFGFEPIGVDTFSSRVTEITKADHILIDIVELKDKHKHKHKDKRIAKYVCDILN